MKVTSAYEVMIRRKFIPTYQTFEVHDGVNLVYAAIESSFGYHL